MENKVQVVTVKNGWMAVGKDWAAFGQTKEQAIEEFHRAEIKHREISTRLTESTCAT